MSLVSDSASRALEVALDLRHRRQLLLSSNIANVDTPQYQPTDLPFDGALRQADEDVSEGGLRLARTDGTHLPTDRSTTADDDMEVVVRPDVTNTLDGNGVDLDMEMARLAENKMRFNATVEATRRRFAILNYVMTTMGTG